MYVENGVCRSFTIFPVSTEFTGNSSHFYTKYQLSQPLLIWRWKDNLTPITPGMGGLEKEHVFLSSPNVFLLALWLYIYTYNCLAMYGHLSKTSVDFCLEFQWKAISA